MQLPRLKPEVAARLPKPKRKPMPVVAEVAGHKLTEQQLLYMCSANAHLWLHFNKISLGHSIWSLKGREYQLDPLLCNAPVQVSKKGSQMGWSETWVLKTMHGLIHGRYPKGALYLFPTIKDVESFSKTRFSNLIDSNPCIAEAVKNTDSVSVKKIGTGFLYLRGAKATRTISGVERSSSQLKSIPVDRIVFDERDEMDDDMVELATERTGDADRPEMMYLGTPTVPDFGVDKMYQESDQRVRFIKCQKCNTETCLELEFPNCLKTLNDGRVIRACKKCGEEIFPKDGRWVAQYPERSKDLVGWWISRLNHRNPDVPGKILRMYNDPPNGKLAKVMNGQLGMAYVAAEDRLTRTDVYSRCSIEPMLTQHDGPCCMGVDVGRLLHVVIGYRKSVRQLKIVKVARVSSFKDAMALAKTFHVKCAVFDLEPETRKVREFQKAANFAVFGCDYNEHQRNDAAWNEVEKIVLVNRTEICDATHNLVTGDGLLELPRRCDEIDEFAKQMCNTAKTLEEDEETGSRRFFYRKLGADHYRHATNYCYLAAGRIGIVSDVNVIRNFFKKRIGRTWMTA